MGKNKLIVKEVVEEQKPEKQKQEEEIKKPPKEPSKTTKAIQGFASGNFIKDYVLKNIPFIFYIALITLIYIANTYNAVGTLRDIEKTKNQIKELRCVYVTTKKELIEKSRRNKVIEKLKSSNKDLKESKVPPFRIVNNLENANKN
jgi:hypothetical protein